METPLPPESSPAGDSGDRGQELTQLFETNRERLRWLIQLRMDHRVQARLDASDVIQEAYAEAATRYPKYLQDPKMPPYLWLRFLTIQQLQIAHRRHLGTQMRSAQQERAVDMHQSWGLESGSIARCLVASGTSPSAHVNRQDDVERLRAALEQLDAVDREILTLKHFEQLEYREIAEIVSLDRQDVAARYRKSLKLLGQMLS
jgi:RNA polymerase sigma-70 factor (ECF subfamily)